MDNKNNTSLYEHTEEFPFPAMEPDKDEMFINIRNRNYAAFKKEMDQKHDVFYVLMKPLNDNQFYDYSETSYVQASPSLEKKLVDGHPNLTNIVGPYMYGKDYDTAILKVDERLRTTIKGYINQYDVVITTLCTIFIVLIHHSL